MWIIEPEIIIKVFICYAHVDQELRKKLEEHLSPLKHSGKITIWQDQEIPAGANWQDQIDTHLNEADIILLLISASFMASKYCWSQEVQTALERHEAGTARVIPILLRPALWEDTPLGKLQALPTEALAVTQWNDSEAALKDVARGVQDVVEGLRSILRENTRRKEKSVTNLTPPQEKIRTVLINNAVVDHTELFGVDEMLERIRTHLTNKEGDWTISLVGEGGIGKTAIAYEVVSRYAMEAGFSRIAWVSAKTAYLLPSGEFLRETSVEFHWTALIKQIADQLNLKLGLDQREWVNEFHKSLHRLRTNDKCLIVVDNLETVQDIGEALQYLYGITTNYKTIQPHKIIFTSRNSVRPYTSNVMEMEIVRLKPTYAFQFIRSLGRALGNHDVENAGDEMLRPIMDATDGNPFLIKLCVRRLLISRLPIDIVLRQLKEVHNVIGSNIIRYLYSESLEMLEQQCGQKIAEGIMDAFCPLGAGNPVNYQSLFEHSHIPDEAIFQEALAVACNLSLIRASNLNSLYSIHSLLWNYICGSISKGEIA